MEDWISRNLMASGDYKAIYSVEHDGVAVQADGFLHLGELACLIESAERERCTKIAEEHESGEHEGYACHCDTDIAAKIRSGE